jgi:hypothetical protein
VQAKENIIKTKNTMKENNENLRWIISICICCCLLSSNTYLYAQTTDYNNLENWEDICYCSTNNSYHPSTIVSADNNWQLLLAMKNGVTLKQLDSLQVPYTKSQLLLLMSQRLLKKDSLIYKTIIPILNSNQTSLLRKQSQFVANEIYLEIEQECRDLVTFLSKQNRSNNAYSILFSYVLDGLIWRQFEKEEIIKETDNSGTWSGNYWFLTPKRLVDCGGTNSLSNEDIEFNWNWSYSEKVTDGLWNKNIEALFPIAQGNSIPDKETINEFAEYGFFDKYSHLTIPVINEKENNDLYSLSIEITDRLLLTFKAKADVEQIKTTYGFSNNSEAVVIFYHEVMFDLMDLLLVNQVIQLPTAFKNSDKATIKDAADLCFIVMLK